MNEEQARAWIAQRWGEACCGLLDRYAALVIAENAHQNLIARSTIDTFWSRHVVDSAQLVPLGDRGPDGEWVDIGSGAGLPGIVAAILQQRPMVLIEPRRRRADFLQSVINELGLKARVEMCAAERAPRTVAGVISARAVARLSKIFAIGEHLGDPSTIWLLPKGRLGEVEIAEARQRWSGVFHVEQSLTAQDSMVAVAQGVKRK